MRGSDTPFQDLRCFSWVFLKRKLSVPVSTMCALKVTRSTIAAQSRGSVNVCFHSENGAFEAMAIARRSSRSVNTWNSSFAPAVNGLPPEEHPFDRSLVHHLTMHARLVRAVQSRLLPASLLRFRLRRSPMRRLAAAYVEAGQGLLPYAERILNAWEHTPPVLDAARIEEYTSRSGL